MDDMHGLRVWDSARELEKRVVAIARQNRLADPAGVMGQLCRAANSVGANIAEAMGSATPGERLNFLRHANRSAWETRHHIRSAWDSGFLTLSNYRWLRNRAKVNVRMIAGLIVNVERAAKEEEAKARAAVERLRRSHAAAEPSRARRPRGGRKRASKGSNQG